MQVPLEAEASTSKSFLTDEWEGGGGGGGQGTTRRAIQRQVILLERGYGSVLSWVQAAQHALPAVHDKMAYTRLL